MTLPPSPLCLTLTTKEEQWQVRLVIDYLLVLRAFARQRVCLQCGMIVRKEIGYSGSSFASIIGLLVSAGCLLVFARWQCLLVCIVCAVYWHPQKSARPGSCRGGHVFYPNCTPAARQPKRRTTHFASCFLHYLISHGLW